MEKFQLNSKNIIVGTGYNGLPYGCSDDEFPWCRDGEFLNTKYPYVCHAELNAVLNSSTRDLSECRIYVVLFPCHECAKTIIQSGIRRIIYLSDKYANTESTIAAKHMLDKANVKYAHLKIHGSLALMLKNNTMNY